MKYLLLTILIITASQGLIAQKNAKAIFFEIGGPGLASVNYDMRLSGKEDGLGFRAGVGGFSLSDDFYNENKTTAIFIPLGVNYLLGKDGKNYFEMGGGVTIVSVSNSYNSSSNETFATSFGHLNFGYRLQPKNGGFLFRAGIVPIFNSNGFVPYYAGVSFGYKF